ncbi:uncharacterized protein TNCV_2925591 [Trichonephila clavipes]|nr:uncharacterized protein TNCV_2925591 [Trichonephila clavipes]
MEVTRVEQRPYIKIVVLRGRNAMECHSELVEALGNDALPYRTIARWRERENCPVLRNSEKENGSSLPLSPRIVTMVRREPEEEKGERGHHVTCVISVKMLDNCPRLRLVNLSTFRLGVFPPRPGNIISGRIS